MAAMDAATTLEALRDAAHAFDRVFMQQHYVSSLVASAGVQLGVVGPPRHSDAAPALLHHDQRHQQRPAVADPDLVGGTARWRQTMTRYIVTRLLLMLPTLLGVLVATFILIQFVPGGPVEQTLAQLRQRQQQTGHGGELDATQVAAIKKLYGFDKPPLERFWLTLSSFARFDFGTSFQNNQRRLGAHQGQAPVSISLGVWSFLAAYLIVDPARHRQGGARRLALRPR